MNGVNSVVLHFPVPWNMVVPPANTTLAYKSWQMSSPTFMMHWKVVDTADLLSDDSNDVVFMKLEGLLLVGTCRNGLQTGEPSFET